MYCEQVIEHYQHVLDSDGALRVPAAVDRHLSECSRCSARIAELQQLHAQLTSTSREPHDALPAGFHSQFMAKLATESVHSPARGSSMHWPLYASIAAAAVFAVFAAMQGWQVAPGPVRNPQFVQPTAAHAPTADQLAAAAALSDFGSFVSDAKLPTAERVYASAAPSIADFTQSLYDATTRVTQSLNLAQE